MPEPTPIGAIARACASACLLLLLALPFQRADARTITIFGRDVVIAAEDGADFAEAVVHGQRWAKEAARAIGARAVYELVGRRAVELGVPARMAVAITHYESGGRCGMHGRAGERGAMQVLPQTARQVGVSGNLDDCATGIEAGLRYLRLAMTMHRDAGWCAVASAYNVGIRRGSHCTRYGRAVAYAAGLR